MIGIVVLAMWLVVSKRKLGLNASLLFKCVTPIRNKRGRMMVVGSLGPIIDKTRIGCKRDWIRVTGLETTFPF